MKNSIIFTATIAAILAMGVFVVPSVVVFADSTHDGGHGQGDEHKSGNGSNSTDTSGGNSNSTDVSGGSNNSTNTSNNSTTTVVFDDNNYRFNGALGFAERHPEIKSVSDIPQSFDVSKNDVQHGKFGGNLFDVLHFLDLKGWKTSDLSDGQFVYMMEHFS